MSRKISKKEAFLRAITTEDSSKVVERSFDNEQHTEDSDNPHPNKNFNEKISFLETVKNDHNKKENVIKGNLENKKYLSESKIEIKNDKLLESVGQNSIKFDFPSFDFDCNILARLKKANESLMIKRIVKASDNKGSINVILDNKDTKVKKYTINPDDPPMVKIRCIVLNAYQSVNPVKLFNNEINSDYYHKLFYKNLQTDSRFSIDVVENILDTIIIHLIDKFTNLNNNNKHLRNIFKGIFNSDGKKEFQKENLNFYSFWKQNQQEKNNNIKTLYKTIINMKNASISLDKLFKPIFDDFNIRNERGLKSISVTSFCFEQFWEIIVSDLYFYTMLAVTKLYPTEHEEETQNLIIQFEKEIRNLPRILTAAKEFFNCNTEQSQMIYEFRIDFIEKKLGLQSEPSSVTFLKVKTEMENENKKYKFDDLYEFIISDNHNYNNMTDEKKKLSHTDRNHTDNFSNNSLCLNSRKKKTTNRKIKNNKFNSDSKEPVDKEIECFIESLKGESINAKSINKIKPKLSVDWINTIKYK